MSNLTDAAYVAAFRNRYAAARLPRGAADAEPVRAEPVTPDRLLMSNRTFKLLRREVPPHDSTVHMSLDEGNCVVYRVFGIRVAFDDTLEDGVIRAALVLP